MAAPSVEPKRMFDRGLQPLGTDHLGEVEHRPCRAGEPDSVLACSHVLGVDNACVVHTNVAGDDGMATMRCADVVARIAHLADTRQACRRLVRNGEFGVREAGRQAPSFEGPGCGSKAIHAAVYRDDLPVFDRQLDLMTGKTERTKLFAARNAVVARKMFED